MQQLSFLPGEMTPGERSLILRALKTLDRHLHEPGVAFTSTRAAREWLILNMAGHRSPREYLRQQASNGLSDNRCLEI